MARVCEVCGKGSQVGNSVEIRGKAKYLGGVGTKITGITSRKFKPNLQSVRVTTAGGHNKRIRVCTQCLRSGGVQRVVRQRPFNLPPVEQVAGKAKAKGKGKAKGKSS